MKYILLIITISAFLSCDQEPANFLTTQFFEELTKSVENKDQLELFKNLPLDSAALNYGKFDDIFQKPIAILFQDSIFHAKFIESCLLNKLEFEDPANGYVIAALYHKYLNEESIQIEKLKNRIQTLVLRSNILDDKDREGVVFEKNCYVNELVKIGIWLETNLDKVNYVDADILLIASTSECANNVEFSEVYNETLYLFLQHKPFILIDLLQNGSYSINTISFICSNLEDPIHDEIDLKSVKDNLLQIEKSELTDQLIKSINVAIRLYSH